MSDDTKIEFKSDPAAAPESSTPSPDVKVQERGGVTSVTMDTTAKLPKPGEPPKPDEKKPEGERPAWLPDEFKTAEEFAEAWKAKKTPEQKPDDKAKPADGKLPEDPKAAASALGKAGFGEKDLQAFSQEYAKDGKLSDATMAKLDKAGFPKATVDAFIAGQHARGEQYKASLAKSLGSEESLTETLKWAEKALTPKEIAAANRAIESMDVEQASLVLQGLNARRVAEVGAEPRLVQGRGSPGRGEEQGYESTQQWMKDVNSPDYKTDPAFRNKVMRRIQNSKF